MKNAGKVIKEFLGIMGFEDKSYIFKVSKYIDKRDLPFPSKPQRIRYERKR